MRSLTILLTKISLQNFSKHKRNDNLNILNISRETLLFIIFAYHAPFVPFTDHPFHFVSMLVLIFLSGLVAKSFFHPEILSTALADALALFLSFIVRIALNYGTCEIGSIILVRRIWN